MRPVSLRLADLERTTIPIGYVDENLRTQIRIDCLKMFEEYPNAIPSLAVQPPNRDAYPAVVIRDGNLVIWDITAADVAYPATKDNPGKLQLTFVEDEVVAKSVKGKYGVVDSIMPTGTKPDVIDNWITEANTVLNGIPQVIEDDVNRMVPPAVEEWLDDHPETVTTVDFRIATKVFPTVADMIADTSLKAGENVATKGYYASGDDGGANYVISSSHTGYFYITLNNGLYANMLSEKGILPAESIGIKKYAAETQNPDSDDMDRNVTLFNLAHYHEIYLIFGRGHFYFSAPLRLEHQGQMAIQGIGRNISYLHFPESNGLYFCDARYYGYYVVQKLNIKSYGHCIVCDESCLTVLDSRFEWLYLTSETGDCFHAPSYNIAKYTTPGGTLVYDTCVQNCVFDFINASAPQGAAFANIMGMRTYYQHMNLVSCKYGFRNCDGIINQLNTLGQPEDYFIYYDKAYSFDLRWVLINCNAEGISKAFIYTEPEVPAPEGEDPKKPDTANVMTISKLTAIHSGWSLNAETTENLFYPITVHQINRIELLNADNIVATSKYPDNYDTDTVKAHILALRSVGMIRYSGGPTISVKQGNAATPFMCYGNFSETTKINSNTVPYTGITGKVTPTSEEIYSKRIYGGKAQDAWKFKASEVSSGAPSAPADHQFCDCVEIEVDTNQNKSLAMFLPNDEANVPGRIVTLVNSANSLNNVSFTSVNTNRNYSNFGLTKDYPTDLVLKPGESVDLLLTREINPSSQSGAMRIVWKPINNYRGDTTSDDIDCLFQMIRLIPGITVYPWVEGYCFNVSGTTVDVTSPIKSLAENVGSDGFSYVLVQCSAGDRFTIINGKGGYAPRLWAFIGSSNNRLSVAGAYLSVDKLTIEAPTDAAYLIVNSYGRAIVYKEST